MPWSMQKKALTLEKKAQKALQPIKKKASPQKKKHKKSTMVLSKALATIPGNVI